MPPLHSHHLAWRKSTHSQGGGADCVEVSSLGVSCVLRDSKDADGPVLAVDASSWREFIGWVKRSGLAPQGGRMPAPQSHHTAWRRSTHSQGGGSDCVEAAAVGDRCALRDSKDADGPVLAVDASSWREFVGRVKRSVYDL
ncbi:DUF397 domain-containing protein [Spirillospora sp. NPDC052269]